MILEENNFIFRLLETGEEFFLIADDARLVCKDDYEQARDKREWLIAENSMIFPQ